MKKQSLFYIISLTVALSGCVSNFKEYQSTKFLSINNTKNRLKALETLSRVLLTSEHADGFCVAGYGNRRDFTTVPIQNDRYVVSLRELFGFQLSHSFNLSCIAGSSKEYGKLSINNNGLSYPVWTISDYFSSSGTTRVYSIKNAISKIDLDDIFEVIVITGTKKLSFDEYLKKTTLVKCKGDYLVIILPKKEELWDTRLCFHQLPVIIGVDKSELDNLMASLSTLAPQAKLLTIED